LLIPPIAVRNVLTVGVIDAMLAPAALNVIALANAGLVLSTNANVTPTHRIAFLGITGFPSQTQAPDVCNRRSARPDGNPRKFTGDVYRAVLAATEYRGCRGAWAISRPSDTMRPECPARPP
jgi:hypothetical protein